MFQKFRTYDLICQIFPKTKTTINPLFKAVQRNEKSAIWNLGFNLRTITTTAFFVIYNLTVVDIIFKKSILPKFVPRQDKSKER